MDSLLRGLNAAQKAAVTSSASVLQVLAPPGSGKTKTLTSRVAYLLAHHGYAPQNVICCTFTIKASREMRERLRGLVGEELETKVILGTFHSICRRYLVAYGHLIGIPQNFGIADSDDSLSIVKRLQKKLKFAMEPRAARSKISHRKAKGQSAETVLKTKLHTIDAQEFALIFQEYEDALATSNLLDYDDLLLKCVELLKKHPQCVANVEALLIDEYQDTNVVQFELIKLLASAKRRVTIVGDPDQSIYGFRSAEIENLQRMKAHFPETVVINLEENYRSSTSILNLAQDVIDQDTDRPNKRLKSTHKYGTLPVLRRLPNPHEEAAWIVYEIKRMTRLTGGCLQHSDIAILLRSAFLSLLIEKALANAGIPYKMVGGRRFFDRVEVRILLDYLRAVCHPDNNSAILSIINTPARKVGESTVAELARVATVENSSLWSIMQKTVRGEAKLDKKLPKPAEQGLADLVNLIKKGQAKLQTFEPTQAPGKLIEFVATSLKFKEYLQKQYKDDFEERLENVNELLLQARDVALQALNTEDQLPKLDNVEQKLAEGSSEVLSRFLANVALSTEIEADDADAKPRITISTIHSAKGLEWPVVFVPAVYEGSIPHSRADDTNEERRLLYVAMTRAQALLYMTFPVLQSRADAESILSQFLPGDLSHRLLTVGPAFEDHVVSDIATILDRPMPLQEDLAKGAAAIAENESQLDDLWPADGTPRDTLVNPASDSARFILQRGQSLADALKSGASFQQTSNFSTCSGFTTAAQQLSMQPQQSQQNPRMQKIATDPASKPVSSASGQRNLSSFFKTGSFKTDMDKENQPPQSDATKRQSTTASSSIPIELSGHKLCRTTLYQPLKRSRSVIEDSDSFCRPHPNFLTPSSLEPAKPGSRVVLPSPKTATNFTTVSVMEQIKTQPNFVAKSFSASALNRPPSLSNLSANGDLCVKKTLGVRRSMTGWADRRHK